jgi:hypothetical protein
LYEACVVRHQNISVVVEVMKDFEEYNRLELNQYCGGKFRLGRIDQKREENLRILLQNQVFLSESMIFKELLDLYIGNLDKVIVLFLIYGKFYIFLFLIYYGEFLDNSFVWRVVCFPFFYV